MAGYPPGSGYPPSSAYPYGGQPPSQPYGGYGPPPAAPYAGYGGPSGPYGGSAPSNPQQGGGYPPSVPPTGPYGGLAASTPQQGGGYPPSGPYGGLATSTPQQGGGYPPSAPPTGPYGGLATSTPQQGGGYPPSAPPAGPYGGTPYGATPFAALVPSAFPPGTDPNVVACFQAADEDGSGFIDDRELQQALSSYNQRFNIRTVHLLMYLFTSSNARRIGPKEFSSLFYSLQNWRNIFERFDRDRSGGIDGSELREALLSLGFSVSPVVLDLLVSKFDKSGGKFKTIEYDNFIECCLTVKGLTEKFKERDVGFAGSATFTYETFLLTVLPFLIA